MTKLSKELVQAKWSSHNFHFIENHLNEVGGTKMNHPSSSNDDATISGALRPKEMKKTELWVTCGSDAGIFQLNTSLVI